VDVAEERLKRFVNHVREVILKLLCPLDVEENIHPFGHKVHFLLVVTIISVAKVV